MVVERVLLGHNFRGNFRRDNCFLPLVLRIIITSYLVKYDDIPAFCLPRLLIFSSVIRTIPSVPSTDRMKSSVGRRVDCPVSYA